jgi:BASS family bile acid:Na+ symporter
MEASMITGVFVPLALGMVMFALGLGLSTADFTRVVTYPKAVLVGLGTQMLLLTAVAYLVARAFQLSPPLAIGLMIIAASPGGAAACLYSHLARGDVALNITLTALNSVLALVWLPIVVTWSIARFYGADHLIPPPFHEVVQVGMIIVLPVLAGMTVHRFAPEFCRRAEVPTRVMAVLGLVALVAAVFSQVGAARFMEYVVQAGPAVLVFNVASLGLGYMMPRLAGLSRHQSKAIALEIGLHNGALAIFVGLTVLRDHEITVTPVVYGVLMFVTGGLFSMWLARRE